MVIDSQLCVVCVDVFDPFEHVVLLSDGWAHIPCADLVTMEPPC
jgi:hypothetical protein